MIRITLKSKLLLDEAAKFDLPDTRIRISKKEHYDFIEIMLVPDSMKLQDAGSILIIPCKDAPGAGAWQVASIKAPHGFGPVLYEFAMELVQLKGASGLTPDTNIVSPEAQRVWLQFIERTKTKEGNIVSSPLPSTTDFFMPRPDGIKQVFRKRNPDLIRKLVAAGKVDDPQGILRT